MESVMSSVPSHLQPVNTHVSLLEPFQTPGKAFYANPTPPEGPACDNVTLGAQLLP